MLKFINFLRGKNVNVDKHLQLARKHVNGNTNYKEQIAGNSHVLKGLKAVSRFLDKRAR